jgi:hypothetical protein
MHYAIKRDSSNNRFFLQSEREECVDDREFPTRSAAEAYRTNLLKRTEKTMKY